MNRRWMAALALGSTLTSTAAADVSQRALTRKAPTAESRCASEMCQSVTDDPEPLPPAPPETGDPPPFSLALGLGASFMRTRREVVQFVTIDESSGDPLLGDAGGRVEAGPLATPESADERIAAYPSFSLALDLQQPLVSLGALDLRLAERFSIASAPRVPGEDLSLFVGFADIVLGAHVADIPVQIGLGPALGMVQVRTDDASGEALLAGVVGVVRVALPGLPGTFDAVMRGTRLLAATSEPGTYRDAVVAYSFPL